MIVIKYFFCMPRRDEFRIGELSRQAIRIFFKKNCAHESGNIILFYLVDAIDFFLPSIVCLLPRYPQKVEEACVRPPILFGYASAQEVSLRNEEKLDVTKVEENEITKADSVLLLIIIFNVAAEFFAN